MVVREFEWDENNRWKPLRHGVLPEEAEEVFFNAPHIRRTRSGRYIAYGVTDEGRYLMVVFVVKPHGAVRPVTARDMMDDERVLYRRHSE